MSHAAWGHLRWTGHSEEFLLQETQEQYGQGGLAGCSSQVCKESDIAQQLNNNNKSKQHMK